MLFLLGGNAAATIVLALAGYLVVRRMLRPLRVLSDHMDRDEGPDLIPDQEMPAGANEFARLFRIYNALVRAERDRQEAARRLAEEERLVSLGRLASGVAHEINNPLGGLLNALDTLKRHGDRPGVTERSIDLLERGLVGIRNVVRAMIEIYRPEAAGAMLSEADLEDLRLLIAPEVRRQGQDPPLDNSPERLRRCRGPERTGSPGGAQPASQREVRPQARAATFAWRCRRRGRRSPSPSGTAARGCRLRPATCSRRAWASSRAAASAFASSPTGPARWVARSGSTAKRGHLYHALIPLVATAGRAA